MTVVLKPNPCKTCGSDDRYFDSKGYARCRTCRKMAIVALGQKRKESSSPPSICKKHNVERYWNNFGDATCSVCVKDKKKRAGYAKLTAPPPTDCLIHNVPRKWNAEGTVICLKCIKEVGTKRLQRKLALQEEPSLCPTHNCVRHWDIVGTAKCPQCISESKQRAGHIKRAGPPPQPCPKHNIDRSWSSEGVAHCSQCNVETRLELKRVRELVGRPDPCTTHQQDRYWNAHGTAICNLCDRDKAHALGLLRMQNGPPSKCTIHDISRYWNIRGVAICNLCKKECAYLRGVRMKESGLPPKCPIHDEDQKWTLDGRARCASCAQEYRNTLDKLYHRWLGMNDRCHNEDSSSYDNYGGRGIYVCESWRRNPDLTYDENYKSYSRFREWMLTNIGDVPADGRTLDRINNNRGYEPGNLRWATKQQQAQNRRVSTTAKTNVPDESIIDYYGDRMTLVQFSELTGIHIDAIKYRYAQHPAAIDWIISGEADNRYYEWNGEFYNLPELCIISGFSYKVMEGRLRKMKWSVDRSMTESLNR